MVNDQTVQSLKLTLSQLAEPGVTPRQLLKGMQARHPKASKKEIALAAFSAMIDLADTDIDRARSLQQFGLTERN